MQVKNIQHGTLDGTEFTSIAIKDRQTDWQKRFVKIPVQHSISVLLMLIFEQLFLLLVIRSETPELAASVKNKEWWIENITITSQLFSA